MNIPMSIKLFGKQLVLKLGVIEIFSRFLTPKGVILRFHSVAEYPERFCDVFGPTIIHPTSVFEKLMQIVSFEYNPITMDELTSYLIIQSELPDKIVVITFDDGFADNYQFALPILEKYGLKATFYLTVRAIESGRLPWFCRLQHAFRSTSRTVWEDSLDGCKRNLTSPNGWKTAFQLASKRCATLSGEVQLAMISRIEADLAVEEIPDQHRFMLNWSQIKEMLTLGHTIGAHSMTHPNLAYIGEEELRYEIKASKRTLEERLGVPIVHFSYPAPILVPHYNERTAAILKEAGYITALTSMTGPITVADNSLELKRMWVPQEIENFRWNLQWTMANLNQ